jgi:hypothetical protein
VNTDKLFKMYDVLTPAERVPLILAARQRGDATEESRLVRSAPVHVHRCPDFCDYESRLTELALRYIARQLELASRFQTLERLTGSAEPLPDAAKVVAYLFVTNAEGWAEFCRRNNVDSANLTSELPAITLLRSTCNRSP